METEKQNNNHKKTIAIVASLIIVCAVFVILLVTVILPKRKDNSKVEIDNTGKYEETTSSVEKTDERQESTSENIKSYKQLFSNADVGSTVLFGSYEQDNNSSNGKEDIEWIVLAKEGSRVLVISKNALDCKCFNSSLKDVTWETCSLRNWLNNVFMKAAFSDGERGMIPTVTISDDSSAGAGNSTTDQVFLLSISEANKYFASDSDRMCQGTAYCSKQGAYVANDGNCFWWLRSPGCDSKNFAYVDRFGSVCDDGHGIILEDYAVRPAMWIEIGD